MSVAEHLPSMTKALHSIPNTEKKVLMAQITSQSGNELFQKA
jgi:hypothetical protein